MSPTSHGLYLDTSALLDAILAADAELARRIEAAVRTQRLFMSRLTLVEAHRTVFRKMAMAELDRRNGFAALRTVAEVAERAVALDLSPAVLRRASGRFRAEPLRTLDALHLATVMELQSTESGAITLASKDRHLRRGARAHLVALAPEWGALTQEREA